MNLRAVILAAGKGTRMNSNVPKVLHKIAGKPLVAHVASVLRGSGLEKITVVASEELQDMQQFIEIRDEFALDVVVQKERLGTAHALIAGIGSNKKLEDGVIVVCGDTPLLSKKTVKKALDKYVQGEAEVVCIAFNAKRPKGYGRIIAAEDVVLDIVEEKEATNAQKRINLCNSGIYILSKKAIKEVLPKIKNHNIKAEFYLTDCVKIANQLGYNCTYVVAAATEVLGVNDKLQLACAEQIIQKRLRKKALLAGVQMLAPNTTYISLDTQFGRDVIIHPHVVIGEGVVIEGNCEIHSFSHIAGCHIMANAKIGPFARIRPKTQIGQNARVGNFVEVKASNIGKNSKASHLAYIGDAQIGEDTNIGAGTIFCNYDGFSKHVSKVGNNVFIGSNSAIVAPINIADSAIVGAGSVVTEDIEENTLTIARVRQVNYKQKAELVRRKKQES